MNKRKISVVTGTRADYGLLYYLIKRLHNDPEVVLQLIVTGMHLSPEFGLTYKQIEADGFHIDKKVEMLLSSDTSTAVSKSTGLAIISFADAWADLQPDLIVLLGDRFETFAAAVSATIARIPIAHCHGGETTEGAIDEPIRHSITKMSHLHFTSTAAYRQRVIQLGEKPERVFNVGALGIESINKLPLLDKPTFEKNIDFKLKDKSILVTFHPVTFENGTAEGQFSTLLRVLEELPEVSIIFTKANADTDGRVINQLIDVFVAQHAANAVAFTSLGQLRYLSALKHVDMMIGNSSSGILEMPSFKKATINIGDRQKGRIMADSVISVPPLYEDIKKAISHAYSQTFQKILLNTVNPYGTYNPSNEIAAILKNISLDGILKKEFHDL